jgi:hypothetical protein
MRNIHDSLKVSAGMKPMIDTEVALAGFERQGSRLETWQEFGKASRVAKSA